MAIAALAATCLTTAGGGNGSLVLANGYNYTTIVDSETILPGSDSAIAEISSAAFDGQQIVFQATQANGSQGVYLWDGTDTTTLADSSTSIPAADGTFELFRNVSIDDGNVAFFGGTPDFQGAYTTLGGSLRRVFDTSMTMPESGATFAPEFFATSTQLDLAIDGDAIAFSARGETANGADHRGVYLETGGNLQRVVDVESPVPGVAFTDFRAFGNVDTRDGEVLFDAALSGAAGSFGIFTTRQSGDDALRIVVDQSTLIPGLDNPLNAFAPNTVQLGAEEIVFAANSAGFFRNGLYAETAGEISIVADEDTPDPRSGNPLRSVGGVFSHDTGNTAFWSASSEGSPGIFLNQGGVVRDVINRDAQLGDRTVAGVGLFQESLRGDEFIFLADFSDGTNGLYLAVPNGDGSLLEGDYNANGLVDTPDVVLWRDTFGSTEDLRADGNGNGQVDVGDYNVWRTNFGQTTLFEGDYNGNGAVDTPDVVLWRDTFGSTTDLRADGNNNGVIDTADYTIWRNNFGASLGPLAVPESTSALLLGIALGPLLLRRCRG